MQLREQAKLFKNAWLSWTLSNNFQLEVIRRSRKL